MSSQSAATLLEQITVNNDVFNALSLEIASNSNSSIKQSVLIIGQNGSGKTTLLKRIYSSEQCMDKAKIWIDGRTIFSSEDIISKAKAVNASVIFIDDLDFYLNRCSFDDQFRLRRFLYNEGGPMMIGTVSEVMSALTEYEAPFFEGLKNIYIQPVELGNLKQLFEKTDAIRANSLLNLLPPTIKSMETIYGIISLNKTPEKDKEILLSIFSEKYRGLYQSLPANSQHILNAFESGIPKTLSELRNDTNLSTNVLTAYLKTIVCHGILKVDKSIKRNSKYSIRDPLFQLWLTHTIQHE